MLTTQLGRPLRCLRHRYYSSARRGSSPSAPAIDTLFCDLNDVPIQEFQERAFLPEKPLHIARDPVASENSVATVYKQLTSLPAQEKWFTAAVSLRSAHHRDGLGLDDAHMVPSQDYLSQFADTILPYELILDLTKKPAPKVRGPQDELGQVIASLLHHSPNAIFHRFNAPLSLFLNAYKAPGHLERLYIAQAQIADLPQQLQDDLPAPKIVMKAGKGDIYDSNIWMGVPPTYTPLHRDPNPNLFLQLAGRKVVRLLEPGVGSRIFREVQQKIGQRASSVFRGEGMMEGPEREVLDKAVWGEQAGTKPAEVTVGPGEALFIPKGWWHSIKSMGSGVTASANWWFR